MVRPEGNLLCAYGFTRYKGAQKGDNGPTHVCLDSVPHKRVSTSGYILIDKDRHEIALWGWGMVYGGRDQGFVFLRRFGFDPIALSLESVPADLHEPSDLRKYFKVSKTDHQSVAPLTFRNALCWIADYERWVLAIAGPDYRKACVESWFKQQFAADTVVSLWLQLADAVQHMV